MKIENSNYYIFFNESDFHHKIEKYIKKKYTWIGGGETPNIEKTDFPIVLNCDFNKTMMFGVIEHYREDYFKDQYFVDLYNREFNKIRIKKLKRILDEDETGRKL